MIIKSLRAFSGKPRFRRGSAAIGVALVAISGLVGCGALAPETGSYLKSIPAALKESDLSVLDVAVGSDVDGLSRSVGVHVYLAQDSVSALELRKTLSIVVPLIDQPGADKLALTFSDASDGFDAEDEFWKPLPIAKARQELLESWGPGKSFGSADTSEDSVLGDLSELKQYLSDTAS